ncbi:tigger transposable element-derived protein 4-like protein [Elysia marginata]|uniref:Tigger transposable element-derived protein 4-like protein n=1 Tax=Elysia marginata TaxID=1093978 RepID=A0AAV4GGC2_9GAST|nr:tigger transposable element-derived protein 4-like protein [Elysia marginata]
MSKRKHSAYTIDFKLQILSEAEEKKLTKTEICKKHSIPNSTLSTILKDTEKLQKARDDSKFRPATKETKLCSHERLEDAVFAWFRQAMAMNVPLSGLVVIGKAAEIVQLMNFKCYPYPPLGGEVQTEENKTNKKAKQSTMNK